MLPFSPVPYLHEYLTEQKLNYRIVVVEHREDGKLFNKGTAMNVAFDLFKGIFVRSDFFCAPLL